MDCSEGTVLMAATLAWKDQGLVLHFGLASFELHMGTSHGVLDPPPSTSQKVQFHITTSLTVALVKSTRVQHFIRSLLPKTCPM